MEKEGRRGDGLLYGWAEGGDPTSTGQSYNRISSYPAPAPRPTRVHLPPEHAIIASAYIFITSPSVLSFSHTTEPPWAGWFTQASLVSSYP